MASSTTTTAVILIISYFVTKVLNSASGLAVTIRYIFHWYDSSCRIKYSVAVRPSSTHMLLLR